MSQFDQLKNVANRVILGLMSRIEQELGLVSDEQQKALEELIDRPYSAEKEHLHQLKRAAQIEISISGNVSRLNQQEQPITEELAQAISSTRNLTRMIIYDRLETLKKATQPYNKSAAINVRLFLEIYQESGEINRNLMPDEVLQNQAAQFIKSIDIDLQAVAYGRYIGLNLNR